MYIKIKKNYFLFSVFVCAGVLFVILSAILIVRVNAIRENVENHVANINILSRFEAETFSIISDIDNTENSKLINELSQLISFPEIPAGVIDFSSLKNNLKTNGSIPDKKFIINELSLFKKSCQYAIGENRQGLRSSSETLSNYWNYTHILLVLASIAFLILPFIAYTVTKTRNQLVKLRQKNNLLLKSSFNMTVLCNDADKIIEFNTVAQKAFGYTFSEVHYKPVSMLYDSPEEYEKIITSLKNTGSFTGEVLNRSKTGKAFHSYLFANTNNDEKGSIGSSISISRQIK